MPRPKSTVPWIDWRGGVAYASWYNGQRRRTERFSLRTRDPEEATARFAAFLTQGKDLYGAAKHTGLTWGQAFDDYIAEHVRVNVVDSVRAEDAIRNLRLFFDHRLVTDTDVPMVREYTAKRMTGEVSLRTKKGKPRPASAGTVKRELGTLLAAANHEVKWKRLKRDDVPVVEKPKTKRSKGLWLFHDELQALRAAADQKTRDFIDLCYFTAARRRSIETLTWFQVDLARGRINLAKSTDPETKKRKPIVPIGPEMSALLTRLSEARSNEYVLGSSASMWSGFKTARRLANLRRLPAKDMRPEGSLSPHVLRHSRATHLLNQGVHPKAVADLLGDDVMTVLRVYGHACPDYLESALGENKA